MTRIAALLLALAVPAAASEPDPRALLSYGFDAREPLPRAKEIPDWLLNLWSVADGRPYKAHKLTAAEKKLLAGAFAGLPAPMRKVLSERLIAVYLIDGLKGNGITDWVLDPAKGTYVYMILNAAGFQQTLSQLLTERDRSVFRGNPDITVSAGSAKGILYSVSHEATHAVDYVMGITPFTDDNHFEETHPWRPLPKDWNVWAEYSKPKPSSDYPLRAKLRFYGFGEPEIEASEAGELCKQWAMSPFASLYGSRSWAEDLAELFVLRHLTQDLGLTVKRTCAGRAYEPWKNPLVSVRAESLTTPLYRPQ